MLFHCKLHFSLCIMNNNVILKSLLMLIFMLQVQLQEPNWAATVTGALGKDVTLNFTFTNISHEDVSSGILYKGGKSNTKISGCVQLDNSNGSHDQQCIFNVASKEASLCLRNVTSEHSGVYWVTLVLKKSKRLVHSNRLSLHVDAENNRPTSAPLQSIHTTEGNYIPSNIHIFYIILAGLVVTIIVLISGLLIWFCWIQKLNSDPSHQNDFAAKSQNTERDSKAPDVYSVEYDTLDFHSHHKEGHRPGIVIRSAPSVEYATITFHRPPQGSCGR